MYAVIDVETGGFSKTKNGLCEIAVIIVNEDHEKVWGFSYLIHPYLRPNSDQLVSYKEGSMAVNGINVEDLYKAPKAEEVARWVEKALIDANVTTIVGHNVKSMDQAWTEYFLERFGTGFKFKESICTLELARGLKLNTPDNKLATLCDFFGIINSDAHRAFGDAEVTYSLWMKLINKNE